MSYIVKALRKLEQERRRVTVTEMTLFRGLSERWQSERPVWRYLLVLSLVVNTGVAVWLLAMFFPGGSGREIGKPKVQATEPSIQFKRETVARPYQNAINPNAPMKISLEIGPRQRAGMQTQGKNPMTDRYMPPLSGPRSFVRHDRQSSKAVAHLPQEVTQADEFELHESGANSLPNVLIWKDEKGNIHYSGSAGKD